MRKTRTSNDRKIKGYAIISKGDLPEVVNKSTYFVPSQSNLNRKYKVTGAGYGRWACNCPDFQNRHLDCKHIISVKFWLNVKDKMENEQPDKIYTENPMSCPYCKSEKYVRNGSRKNNGIKKQTYRCNYCKRYFVEEPFKKIKGNAQVVTLIMDLFYKGISLRKIQNHLEQIYGIKISHVTIYSYVKKFTKIIDNYVKQFNPKASDMWHTDEMMIDSNGKKVWLWNCMDRDTRFMLRNLITQERTIEDAESVFAIAKQTANSKPMFMVTDGLQSYKKAFRNQFFTLENPRSEHIQGATFQDKINNNILERLNGSARERTKVMRGMKKMETATAVMNGYRNYYNYVRPHQGLDGATPSEKARIDLKLDRNKWLSLIRQASYGV